MTATLSIPVSMAKDLLTGAEWSPADTRDLLQRTALIKAHPSRFANTLRGKHIALIFEKPSLRTRVTFEVGIQSMGGNVVFLDHTQARLGERESIPDVARNLERWVQGIVARVYQQHVIDEMAESVSIPVINALSDRFHPCQALADFFTLEEKFGSLRGFKLAYVGDGNNVAHSLMLSAARLGMDFALATPAGYVPDASVVAEARELAARSGSTIVLTGDPQQAVMDADAVYTDVWASMGQEGEAARRRAHFAAYQIDEELFAAARPGAIFMHCLPAHRDEEVTDAVMESARSVVFDQAENRLHVQKALLLMLLA